MKSGKSWWAMVGAIALESIWIIDLAVNLCAGEITYAELLWALTFCSVSAVVFVSIIKSKNLKGRENAK